jgi:hypothetical protein
MPPSNQFGRHRKRQRDPSRFDLFTPQANEEARSKLGKLRQQLKRPKRVIDDADWQSPVAGLKEYGDQRK